MNYVKCDHISTDRLIQELETRQREGPGAWTGHQCDRIRVLSDKLNPPPLDVIATREVGR